MTSFEVVLHHLRDVAALAVPEVAEAAYAEWWAHSRLHANGHKLHYDYVEEQGIKRHPIVSTVCYLTDSCGGPTLVTDQRMSAPQAAKGWVVAPRLNRLLVFDGSLLHCVLPGLVPPDHDESPCKRQRSDADASAGAEGRRLTFMVAFWKQDPHAPPFPTVDGQTDQRRKGLRKRKKNVAKQWPKTFVAALPQAQLAADSHKSGGTTVRVNGCEVLRAQGATQCVAKLWEATSDKVTNTSTGVDHGGQEAQAVDLLDPKCFSSLAALDSGLLMSKQGECSLNCGGTCEACIAAKVALTK